jgi:hypothetical protein
VFFSFNNDLSVEIVSCVVCVFDCVMSCFFCKGEVIDDNETYCRFDCRNN